tara:strand:+ start:811 stop:987 length:177 start_codon:yes stop_codon:yes gene_type:complete
MDTYIKSKIEGLEDHIKTQDDTIKQYRNIIDKKDVLIDELLEELRKLSDDMVQIIKKL